MAPHEQLEILPWAEDLNCFFPVLGLEIIVEVLASILIDYANTLIDFEKLFKGLQFGLDRVFKHSEFVPRIPRILKTRSSPHCRPSNITYSCETLNNLALVDPVE